MSPLNFFLVCTFCLFSVPHKHAFSTGLITWSNHQAICSNSRHVFTYAVFEELQSQAKEYPGNDYLPLGGFV